MMGTGSPSAPILKACACLVDARGRLLVFRHPEDGNMQLPKGTIEPGESPEAAVRRELLEESGLDFTGPLQSLGTLDRECEAGVEGNTHRHPQLWHLFLMRAEASARDLRAHGHRQPRRRRPGLPVPLARSGRAPRRLRPALPPEHRARARGPAARGLSRRCGAAAAGRHARARTTMYSPNSASPIRKQRRNTATDSFCRSQVPSTMPPMAGASIATEPPSADIG